MSKTTYRVLRRKNQRTCDVEMTEPGATPRIVNTFNSEPEAWDWVNEQEHVAEFSSRPPRSHRRPQS